MPRGYEEGPVAEEAERRRNERRDPATVGSAPRRAVFGSTKDDPEPHFIGWLGDVDPDALFASGDAWGLTVRLVTAP